MLQSALWPREPLLGLYCLLLLAAARKEALLDAVTRVRVVTRLFEAQHDLAHFHRGSRFIVIGLDDLDDTLHSGINGATVFKYTAVREAEAIGLLRAFEQQRFLTQLFEGDDVPSADPSYPPLDRLALPDP